MAAVSTSSRRCRAGDGCDGSLAWWFSEEAKEELRKARARPPSPRLTLDDLPEACRSILSGF